MLTELQDPRAKFVYHILHHSWSEDNSKSFDTANIIDYHEFENGWLRGRYHRINELVRSRPLTAFNRPLFLMDGAHTLGFNKNSLGTCIIGRYDKDPIPENLYKYTIEQLVVDTLTFGIPVENIIGHWETFILRGKARTKVEAQKKFKTCPGLLVDMDQVRNDVYRRYEKYMRSLQK